MTNLTPKIWILAVLVGISAVVACNLGDPIEGPPDQSDCSNRSDCSGNGECNDGFCTCDEGYSGDLCDSCASGYSRTNGDCVMPTTNNGIPDCSTGEIVMDGECVEDLCADAPCGPGTCMQTDPLSYECACPDGSTADSCPDCDDGTCINGTCNMESGMCECDELFTGATCDECVENRTGNGCLECVDGAYGPDCLTCDQIYEDADWWDTAYSARAAVVVENPAGVEIAGGIHVPATFNHESIVEGGGMMGGQDLRAVFDNEEIDRLLGPDSSWNDPATTVLFANPAPIPKDGMNVVFLYAVNPEAEAPPNDPRNVLLPDRGWAYDGNDQNLYAIRNRESGALSLQFRQTDVQSFEVHVRDASDDSGDTISFQVRDMDGLLLASRTFRHSDPDLGGTAMDPETTTVPVAALPGQFELTIESNSVSPVAHWYGIDELTSMNGFAQSRTYTREMMASPEPDVTLCEPEMQ